MPVSKIISILEANSKKEDTKLCIRFGQESDAMEKIDLEYPLTPVPLSLPHADGSMNTTDKSKNMHEIDSYLEDSTAPPNIDVCNISSTFTEESSVGLCGSELIHKSHVGHGCVLDAGTYKIQCYDGDQLPFDIYRALDMDMQAYVAEEAEDEEVTYGEDYMVPMK